MSSAYFRPDSHRRPSMREAYRRLEEYRRAEADAAEPGEARDLADLVRESMPGMKILGVAPAASPDRGRPLAQPDASRRRPSPQAAANSRRGERTADRGEKPAPDESAAPEPQTQTYFVSVEPQGVEDDPAIRAATRRHVPIVGRRIVALPDSYRHARPADADEKSAFRFPDPEDFRR